MIGDNQSVPCDRLTKGLVATALSLGVALLGAAAATSTRPAQAVPAFAQQTGQPCKGCHLGGFGPELTPFGREFKLGGYTLRAHQSLPLAAMGIASFTHTNKGEVPQTDHLHSNDNLVVDQVSIFLAGGVGPHFGGFAQVTYDGVGRSFAWDNLDLRAVSTTKLFGADSVLGVSINNSPTVQDPWNTLPAWAFPFTDTAVSPTPDAAPLIDGALAQNVMGMTGYAWIGHRLYLEAGGYATPSRGTLDFLGSDPLDPGKIHGIAPYMRSAFQTQFGGGTIEFGANALKASIFPGRDRSSGTTDRYTDLGLDASWQKSWGTGDSLSLNFRYEHEKANLRASCMLGLLGDDLEKDCARYTLDEMRAVGRYTWHDHLGLTLSPFSVTGSQNTNVFEGNGRPTSNGIMGQVDYTFWPKADGPLGPRVNLRIGLQYTAYGKFNGAHRNFDGSGANASDNNALRLFAWFAF